MSVCSKSVSFVEPPIPPSEYLALHHDENLCDRCKHFDDLESRHVAALVDAKKRLAEAKDLVASLITERINLRSIASATHDRLVNGLPLELVSYIFKTYVQMHEDVCDDDDFFPYFSASNAPLCLGSISRTWRAIAWSLPCLWTTMAVELNPHRRAGVQSLVKEWLGRAAGLPLYIHLYLCVNPYDREHYYQPTRAKEEEFSPVVDAINEFSSQWKHLDVALTCNLLSKVKPVNIHVNGEHPSILQYLRFINVDSDQWFSLDPFLEPGCGYSPTHISVLNITMYGVADTQLKNVTHFDADGISTQDCLSVIEKAPCLTECVLLHVEGKQHSNTTILTNTVVRSLKITSTAASYKTKALLDGLSLPSLKRLDYYGRTSPMVLDSLILFLRRSLCSLETFTFQQLRHDNDHIVDGVIHVLQTIRMLKTLDLELNRAADVDRVLKCLYQDIGSNADSAPFLPNLETLHIAVDHTFNWTTLLDIFGLNPASKTQNTILQRKSLKIDVLVLFYDSYDPEPDSEDEFHEEPDEYIDEQTLRRLCDLLAQGIEISIVRHDKCFIKSSLEYHASRRKERIEVPATPIACV